MEDMHNVDNQSLVCSTARGI